MAHTEISYNLAGVADNHITKPTALSVTETDLYVVTDLKFLQKSQLTIYAGVTLGAVPSATFNYYYSPDNGTKWYPVCLYNTSSGEITQRSVVVDSGTYVVGGESRFADNVPLGGCTQFKVTGKSSSGTPTLGTVSVFIRDN